MSKTAVFCVIPDAFHARRLVEGLHGAGFAYSEISMIHPHTHGEHGVEHISATKAPDGAATGALAGGVTGGVLGLLAGIGALAIPGVGPLLAAGPIMAALSAGAVGAAAGGLVGSLIGLGIPELEAGIYETKLREGNFVIAVHTHNAEEETRARQVFHEEQAQHVTAAAHDRIGGG